MAEHIPSPADQPEFTAEELLDEIEARGGRIFCMSLVAVFCLTQDQETAFWLRRLGGMGHLPHNLPPEQLGDKRAYKRTPEGPWEWDIYIHTIPVRGERTIHEVAKERYPNTWRTR